MRKIVSDIGTSGVSTTEYLDGFQYNNSILQFFSHPEGYVLNTPDRHGNPSYDYVYQYKDYLGNIRMNFVFDPGDGSSSLPQLKILEENHYYPFGLKHENYNVTKKKMKWETELIGGEEMELKRVRQVPNSGYQYKYNGKEWQDELSLNLYDYHARNYDPAIGRWMNIDPLAEKMRRYSPYNYAFNNPVFFINPDGREPESSDDDKPKRNTRTIDNTFKYDTNKLGNKMETGTDYVTETIQMNVSYKNENDVSVYQTTTVSTTMSVDSEGNVSSDAIVEIKESKNVGGKVTFTNETKSLDAKHISPELKNAVNDVATLKANDENGKSPVQVNADKMNTAINLGISIGTGGVGGAYVKGAQLGAKVGAAQFAVMEGLNLSNIVSPESLSRNYLKTKF